MDTVSLILNQIEISYWNKMFVSVLITGKDGISK